MVDGVERAAAEWAAQRPPRRLARSSRRTPGGGRPACRCATISASGIGAEGRRLSRRLPGARGGGAPGQGGGALARAGKACRDRSRAGSHRPAAADRALDARRDGGPGRLPVSGSACGSARSIWRRRSTSSTGGSTCSPGWHRSSGCAATSTAALRLAAYSARLDLKMKTPRRHLVADAGGAGDGRVRGRLALQPARTHRDRLARHLQPATERGSSPRPGTRPPASGTRHRATRSPSCGRARVALMSVAVQPRRIEDRRGVVGQHCPRLRCRAPATRSRSSTGTRPACGTRRSAPTGRGSSPRPGTRRRASGMPRPARRSWSCAGTRPRSMPPATTRADRASSPRRRITARASGTLRPARRSPPCAGTTSR